MCNRCIHARPTGHGVRMRQAPKDGALSLNLDGLSVNGRGIELGPALSLSIVVMESQHGTGEREWGSLGGFGP